MEEASLSLVTLYNNHVYTNLYNACKSVSWPRICRTASAPLQYYQPTNLLLAELSQPTGWLRPCLSQQYHNYKTALRRQTGVPLRTLNLIRLLCPLSTSALTWTPQQRNKSISNQETLFQQRGQRAAQHQGCYLQSQRHCIL